MIVLQSALQKLRPTVAGIIMREGQLTMQNMLLPVIALLELTLVL